MPNTKNKKKVHGRSKPAPAALPAISDKHLIAELARRMRKEGAADCGFRLLMAAAEYLQFEADDQHSAFDRRCAREGRNPRGGEFNAWAKAMRDESKWQEIAHAVDCSHSYYIEQAEVFEHDLEYHRKDLARQLGMKIK